MLNNIKTVQKDRGFTIVELLIVIVVIAILAAITIVAYNGIQTRGKTTAAQSAANGMVKKLEAWNALVGNYPTYCQLATNTTNGTGTATGTGAAGCTAGATAVADEAKLDSPSTTLSSTAVTSANGTSFVQVVPCGSAPHTGVRVNYFHYTNNAITSNSTTPASPTVGTGC